MLFIKSSAKPTKKVSSDSAALSFDLLSNLTYMAALAASYASRDKIFERAIEQPFKTSVYFKQVYLLSKKLGFEYARAFQLAAKRASAETVKGLLLRFASAIDSGESELDFLTKEAQVEQEMYTASYMRQIESLQKWGDAYAALIVSASVIVVVVMVSNMLYKMGNAFVGALSILTIILTFFGSYVINKSAPFEIKPYRKRRGPRSRRRAILCFYIGAPIGLVVGGFAALSSSPGLGFLIVGIALIPSGIFAYMDDMRVDKIDQEVATFVRSVGRLAGALGTTTAVAAARMDRKSLGALEPYIHRLQTRLKSNLSPELCWESFRDEVGSELMNRSSRMLVDGAALGGPPERVADLASNYALNIALLRAKRKVASGTFAYLTMPLHFALTSLMVFILEVMHSFDSRLNAAVEELSKMGGGSGGSVISVSSLPVFQHQDLAFVSLLTLVVIVGFTIANTITPLFATGGHPIKTTFYASIMCIFSGISLMVVPSIAQKFLNR